MTFFGPDIRNGVPVGLGSTAAFGRRGYSPASLFAQGEPGVWYDPADLSTLFTTSAGTTPVTGVEQAVGLVLDKSRGLAIGPELVTNGDFSSGTGWTTGAGWSIGSGVATSVNGALLTQALSSPVGKTYLITITVVSRSSGSVFVSPGGNAYSPAMSAAGTYTFRITATAGSASFFYVDGGGTFNGSIDNVSVREIAGTHRIQPNAASRAVLRNRYNLLTYSEQFDNAAWQKVGLGTGSGPVVTANAATAPDGTTTADLIVFNRGAGNAVGDQSYIVQTPTLVSATYTQYIWLKAATGSDVGKQLALRNAGGSGYAVVTLTADWVRYTRTETGSSGNWEVNNRGTVTADNSVSAHVWGADLRTANDTVYPYQRIEAATVYDSDTSKFPLYLEYDGSDDSYYTAANLDLSGTDKVSVFAGLTKLSDATRGMVIELGNNSATGAWHMNAPHADANATFSFTSTGTAFSGHALQTSAAPSTQTLTGIGDIAADIATLRMGGVAVNNATDQGTGNYGSYPLNIGRRNNATLPFRGREYQTIVRGVLSSTPDINSTERYIANQKMLRPL